MKTPWEFANWNAWQGTAHVLLSDQDAKHSLGYFKSIDDAINWLYANGYKTAARSLNEHKRKEN